MSWKLYKSGQGYWTRMLSGVGSGILIAGGAVWIAQKLSTIQGDHRIYVQSGAALAVVLLLAPLVYRLVGAKQRSVDFLIQTEGEMKKVNWPSQKEVTGSTWVVIWCVVLLTALLFIADALFATIFQAIGILEKA